MSKKVFVFIKYLCFFALFYILWKAKIGGLNSFAFGLYFSLIWCGQSVFLLSPLYVASSYLSSFNFYTLICACITVGVFLLFYFLHYRFKKPLNIPLIMCYGFLSQVGFMYLNSGTAEDFFVSILSVLCGIVFLYCCLHFFQNLLIRGLRRKFYIDEAICAGVMIIVFSAGLYSVPYGEYIHISLGAFLTLLSLWVLGASGSVVSASLFGLGASLCTQNIAFIVRFVLLGLSASTMKSNKRIFAVLAVVLIDVLIELYFLPVYALSTIISVVVGALLFLAIPNKALTFISNFVIPLGQNNVLYNTLERQRKDLESKLHNLSNVFFEMKNNYISMVKNSYNTQDVIKSVNMQITQTVCSHCPNKDNCLTINSQETNYHLKRLTKFAYTRGSVNIIDAEPTFSRRCIRLPVVINAVNNNIKEYKQTAFNNQTNNESKLMMAEQLFGVSQIFKNLSLSLHNKIVFDVEKESEIIESLSKNLVLCTECLVYNEDKNNIVVTLNVRNKDLLYKTIEQVVSNCLNANFYVHSTMHSTANNYTLVVLRTKNVYNFIYGCAGVCKYNSTVSGDSYMAYKIDNRQMCLSICDGMGSGKTAESLSARAISLIENFYKAGFSSDVTLKIVNSLLSQRGEDNFSAIDLGVIDLQNGVLNLYKVGAPCSFLKQKDSTTILSSGALPLGILKDIKPSIKNVVLNDGDYIILLSDGVVDAFVDIDKLKDVILNAREVNPQLIANEILNSALKVSNNMPKDDMTVLVGRLIKN